MAGGLTYTATESTAFSTAEIYGKALCELGEKEVLNKKYMKRTYREICLSDKEN